jgi:hypothetical protein
MTTSPQPGIAPSREFDESGAPSQDISRAKSVTFIIHGVGETTSKELLDVTGKGFLASTVGGYYERTQLSECPSLSGKNGAEAIFIHNPHGDHYVVALPWTDRPVRLALIAQSSAIMLLVVTILVIIAFPFRHQLSNFNAWMTSMTHRAAAYAVVWVLGGVKETLNPKSKFHAPYGLLLLPLFLDIGLQVFIDEHFGILIPLAVLVIVLLVTACVSIARCVPLAPTAPWRLSLVALIVALGLPVAAVIGAIFHIGVNLPKDTAATSISNVKVKQVFDPIQPSQPRSLTDQMESAWEDIKLEWALNDDFELHDLVSGCVIALACMGSCVTIILFNQFGLDFGIDVLNYASHENDRALLLSRTADAIRWIHSRAPSAKLIVVGHSLGSAIASHAVISQSLAEPIMHQITLVTLGSPLNYLGAYFQRRSSHRANCPLRPVLRCAGSIYGVNRTLLEKRWT